jgi:DNA-3-methyladenine glycosylase
LIYDPLPRDFYARETTDVAKELLGKILVRRLPGNALLQGRIVEVEAYRGEDDPASHAHRGLTRRNAVMFQQVGLAYVYFIYGNHYCLNATARCESENAGAVLLRALEPIKGIQRMVQNRGLLKKGSVPKPTPRNSIPRLLTNGPGKLTEAMKINWKLNGTDLTSSRSELLITRDPDHTEPVDIESTKRIGVSAGRTRRWRFYMNGNEFISRP